MLHLTRTEFEEINARPAVRILEGFLIDKYRGQSSPVPYPYVTFEWMLANLKKPGNLYNTFAVRFNVFHGVIDTIHMHHWMGELHDAHKVFKAFFTKAFEMPIICSEEQRKHITYLTAGLSGHMDQKDAAARWIFSIDELEIALLNILNADYEKVFAAEWFLEGEIGELKASSLSQVMPCCQYPAETVINRVYRLSRLVHLSTTWFQQESIPKPSGRLFALLFPYAAETHEDRPFPGGKVLRYVSPTPHLACRLPNFDPPLEAYIEFAKEPAPVSAPLPTSVPTPTPTPAPAPMKVFKSRPGAAYLKAKANMKVVDPHNPGNVHLRSLKNKANVPNFDDRETVLRLARCQHELHHRNWVNSTAQQVIQSASRARAVSPERARVTAFYARTGVFADLERQRHEAPSPQKDKKKEGYKEGDGHLHDAGKDSSQKDFKDIEQ
ncbi:hypothetical protein L596_001598 [Steinernema carpocapsae]|uniref:Uncharacterized protein n=1 Tax=Steinernema carpocapsae TaxID=34508 RepID=A0A4U8UM75_STECR|nr:hypothetical protein L596_001598 [Steinernema carpocapsae]